MGYGNLAYRLEQEEKERQIQKINKRRMQTEARRESRRGHLNVILCAVAITISAFFMISSKVELYETELEIASLKKQLATAESVTCQKTFELENMVDLKTVEEAATTRLGMQRPEKYQVVYINVNKEDSIEVTADQVEGVGNRINTGYDVLKRNIVGIFDIN